MTTAIKSKKKVRHKASGNWSRMAQIANSIMDKKGFTIEDVRKSLKEIRS